MTRAADAAMLPPEAQPAQVETESELRRMYALEEVRIRSGGIAALCLALVVGIALALYARPDVARAGMWLGVVVIALMLAARQIARSGIASIQDNGGPRGE